MKKKIILSSALLLALSVSVQSKEETIEKVFYGSKARKSMINPCKGPLVEVCGRVIKHISMIDASSTMTESTLKDKEGNVVLVDVKYDDIRPYKIIKEDLEQRGFNTIGYEYPGSLTTTP